MNLEDLDHLLAVQDGVVSRVQVLKCGGKPHDIRRRLRRREWASLSDGGSIGAAAAGSRLAGWVPAVPRLG